MIKTRTAIAFIVGILTASLCFAKSLDDQFLYSTAFIKNQSTGGAGSGFLVFRMV